MMATDDISPPADVTTERFEEALSALVLEFFANGASVEGTWRIDQPCSVVPNWTVEIRKLAPGETAGYDARLIDE